MTNILDPIAIASLTRNRASPSPSPTMERTPPGSAAIDPLETTVYDPLQFPTPRASTGTVDDADAPADEHEGENEASSSETDEDMETPEEFEGGDEAGAPIA